MEEKKEKKSFLRSRFMRKLIFASFVLKIIEPLIKNGNYYEFVNNNETIIRIFLYTLISIVSLYSITKVIMLIKKRAIKRNEEEENQIYL